MSISLQQLRTWERAEIERSDCEAALKDDMDLRVSARTFERYLAPPADTPHAIEYAYNLLGDVKGKNVLDLGCGNGENTILLVNRGAKVSGLDISDSLINLARRRMQINEVVEGFEFFTGSAHELPFPDRSFDVVFGMAILHHLDLEQTSREVWRVLRPGGCAIFMEPVRNSKLLGLIRKLIPYRAPDVSPFERPLTDLELEQFAARFSRYQSAPYQLPYVNVAEALPVARDFVTFFLRLDHALLQRAEWLRWYATVRVIKVVK
jgi:ubiquinone/menaquinone biosynthesis C-methylase UbiE